MRKYIDIISIVIFVLITKQQRFPRDMDSSSVEKPYIKDIQQNMKVTVSDVIS